jgi:hypothetical protein
LKIIRPLSTVMLALAAGLLAVPAVAEAATSQEQARAKALDALDVRAGSRPVIVFQSRRPLKRGTAVRQAGLADAKRTRVRVPSAGGRLRKAGISLVKAPLVARVGGERAWFFYEDRGPYQAYQHPGRIVLVGVRSGKVEVSKSFDWPPLINGRRPVFLRYPKSYRAKRYRAFERSWRMRKPQGRRAAVTARAASRASRQRSADLLATERSCAVRLSGTIGSSRVVAPVGRSRTRLSDVFDQLEQLNGGFASDRYRASSGMTPQRYVSAAIAQSGCRDVLLYLAGAGYRDGEPGIVVGTRTRADGTIEQQLVTAGDLRSIMRANPGVTFKLLLDAPGSGAFLPVLDEEPNLLIFLSSASAGEGSFSALFEVVDSRGKLVSNSYNRLRQLEFSNRQLNGIECFLSSPAEVERGARAVATAEAPSFLAWMLARGSSLCGDGFLVDSLRGAPDSLLKTFGWKFDGGDGPAPNRPPTAAALSLSTDEDTPAGTVLQGSDPDGDPIEFAIADQPAHGVVSGSGTDRTYTPDADFNGTDSFTYSVDDGRGGTATGSVSVTVGPVNDAPAIAAGVGDSATEFVEAGAPVAVDSMLDLVDVDDAELTGATVAIVDGLASSEDELLFTDQNGISGSYASGTGVLTLTGVASVADYQAALRSIRYDNSSSNPQAEDRTVSFRADDGDAVGEPAERTVELTTVNDAPVLGGGGSSAAFTEDDTTGVVVNGGVTVADVDNANIAGATVQITTNRDATDDELLFATQNGISGSYAAGTGTLTLTGSATKADYQAALRSIRYRNNDTGDPSTATRTVTFQVTDGGTANATSNTISGTVTVTAVNDAPTLTAGGAAATFTEGGSAGVAVDPGLVVADADDTNLESATVSITGGFDSGEDELLFTDQNGIAGSYASGTGILTLTGSATKADYQAALRSIQYFNSDGDDPSAAQRTIGFRVNDGALNSNVANANVTVTAVNDAPVLAGGGNTEAYTEDDSTGVVVNPAITVADVDNANIASATVAVTGNLQASEDQLVFTDQNGISGSYSASTGVLALTGSATKAEYQGALRSIRYRVAAGVQPSELTRTVSFTVADGAVSSNTIASSVTVAAVNDAPELVAGGGTPSFTEGGSGTVVDPGIVVSDVDDANLASATIAIADGFETGEDELLFTDQIDISGSYASATGVLTLTGSATKADYQAALRSVEYRNNDAVSPAPGARGIDFRVQDSDAANSNIASTTLTVIGVNDAPALGAGGNTVAYVEDDPATPVNPDLTVSDNDDAELESAEVAIGEGFDSSEDELIFVNQNGITGVYDTSTGVLTLIGAASVADYQAALRSVDYRNNDQSGPSTADRSISFAVNDGEVDSNAVTTTVTVAQVADAPILTAGSNAATFTEGGAPVVVDDAITVSDIDSVSLTGATVSISAGFVALQGDTLGFADQNGIAGNYDGGTGVLTLSGLASVADYQAALRTVTFSNTSDAPTPTRTISFEATDGGATSAPATHAVALVGVNDAPTVVSGATLDYTEDDSATAIDPALTVDDVDSATIAGATVTIDAGYANGQDVLSLVPSPQNGISGSFDAGAGKLTLSGSASVANYETALRAVRYVNTSNDPSATDRAVTFEVADSGSPAATGSATATVEVTPVNDAPTVGNESSSTTGNTRLAYGTSVPGGEAGKQVGSVSVLTNDSDVDGPGPLQVNPATSSATGNQGGTVTWNADGTFAYVPAAGFTGTETLTYKVTDQGTPAAEGTGNVSVAVANRVWYVDNQATAGGNGRSSAPFDTLAEADTAANATGDRIYVFEGDASATGLGGGFALLASQQLIGETRDLVVGGDTLYDSDPADRPTVQGTIALDDGNTVTGLKVQASGAAALAGATGDDSGTIADIVVEASTGGSGLNLNATSGTWNISDLAVSSAAGDGIVVASAGTVNFVATGTISSATTGTGGRALAVSGTQTSGTIDSLTTAASPTNGVSLVDNTGSLTLDDLNLTTTGTALRVQSSNDVTVNASGDASIVSSAGAVDVNTDTGGANPANAPDIALGSVTSNGGAYGIRIADVDAGTFAATSGSLQGQTTSAIDVSGGSGTISYGGVINNGTGLSASVSGRTAGSVTLSGSINDTNDAGGGISATGNSGGTTTFSGSTKKLETTTGTAVNLTFTGGHTVNFTGGGLDIDTTTGTGFNATGSGGLVSVQGTGNSIASGTGTAFNFSGPDFTANDATFQSISSATPASGTGIVVADTGSAGGLHVTGSPVGSPAAASGGTISGAAGPGVNLSNTADVELSGIRVMNGGDDGISGSNVAGLTMTAAQITGNGNAVFERGLDLTQLSGSAALTGVTVSGSADDNVRVANDSASLSAFNVDGGTYATNSTTTGNDGIMLVSEGTGSLTATIQNATFTNNRGDHVQVTTDASTTATQNVTIANNDMNADGNQPGFTTLGGGITVNPGGSANTTVSVTGNDIERARDSAIVLNIPEFRDGGLPSNATLKATVSGNFIGTAGEADSGSATGDGIYGNFHGNSTATVAILNNDIRRYVNAFGIDLVQNDGDGTMNATVKGNTVSEPGAIALSGMRIVAGSDVDDGGTSCLDIGDPSNSALKNQFFGTGVLGAPDIRFRMAGGASGAPSTARLVGYSGGAHDTTAVNNYLAARNNTGGTPVVSSTQFDAFSVYESAVSCPTP